MRLTTKEATSLRAIAENGMESMGGKEPKDLLDDNYSWFDREVITERTGYSKHVASGIISALELKGLIVHHDDDEAGWALTEEGINETQDYFNWKRINETKTKEIKMRTSDLNELTGPELVKLFNELAEDLKKPLVKKFTSKAVGIKRILALREEYEAAEEEKITGEAEKAAEALVGEEEEPVKKTVRKRKSSAEEAPVKKSKKDKDDKKAKAAEKKSLNTYFDRVAPLWIKENKHEDDCILEAKKVFPDKPLRVIGNALYAHTRILCSKKKGA